MIVRLLVCHGKLLLLLCLLSRKIRGLPDTHPSNPLVSLLKWGLPSFRGGDQEQDVGDGGFALPKPGPHSHRKVRYTQDVIWNLLDQRGVLVLTDESLELRAILVNRAEEYLQQLADGPSSVSDKPPHPSKVLHFIAPKIPAIKRSPDYLLRIQSARSDLDSGVAACAIGVIASICEVYDKRAMRSAAVVSKEDYTSVGKEILQDRRFQQLVECVLCGVDVKKRKREATNIEKQNSTELPDIEEFLDVAHAHIDDGLSVEDSCRVAWGLSLLGGHNIGSFGGENGVDILEALSLRVRELLLARLQNLRNGLVQREEKASLTMSERFNRDAEELAEDACVAMWCFACAKACTGLRTVPLFETCCSILCQNPSELRLRAQENKTGFDDTNFEVDDVVERLARSEDYASKDLHTGEHSSENQTTVDRSQKVNELWDSTLFDCLSPFEAIDAMWALGLHGSTFDESSKEEVTLSETAAALREIAFDRLLEWLRTDRKTISEVHDSTLESSVDTDSVEGQTEEMVVEVVDAATLLASEQGEESLGKESIAVQLGAGSAESDIGDRQETQLLERESPAEDLRRESLVLSKPEKSINFGIPTEAGTEQSEPKEPSGDLAVATDHQEPVLSVQSQSRLQPSTFSPNDLISIAWAVTDLGDSLRDPVVEIVTSIFLSCGKQTIDTLVGSDIANLAWAMARRLNEQVSPKKEDVDATLMVISWLVESAYEKIGGENATVSSVLQNFQPPELGRLMWAITSLSISLADSGSSIPRDSSEALAVASLKTANSELSLFGTEDLARITWGFLTLCRERSPIDVQWDFAASLGRVIATIEGSILRWETGECGNNDSTKVEESIRFASFLGKSRLSLSLLNQYVADYEDEDEGALTKAPTDGRSSLPLLRDLSLDPATICKLASGTSSYSQVHPNIGDIWTFTRVAVRLLVARNGQLMKQCSITDVIRVCFACANNELPGYEREFISRLFTRRFLQLLNTELGKFPTEPFSTLFKVDASKVVFLLWSLSEVGVKIQSQDEETDSAYRKLRLAAARSPVLSDDQIERLSPFHTVKLLQGLVNMGFLAVNLKLIAKTLQLLEGQISLPALRFADLRDVIRIVDKVKRAVLSTEGTMKAPDAPAIRHDELEAAAIADGTASNGNLSKESTDSETQLDGRSTLKDDLLLLCGRIMEGVADKASSSLHEVPANELRQLLVLLSTTPIESTALVDAISDEVSDRLCSPVTGHTGPQHLLSCAPRATPSKTRTQPESTNDRDSPIAALKNRLGSFFAPSQESSAEIGSTPEVQPELQDTSNTAEELEDLPHEESRKEEISQREGHFREIEGGILFELGRCQELINSYRRIEFDTGRRETRYDRKRRNDIGKRALSRLFRSNM